MEQKRRSLAKAISWRLLGTVVTGTIVWILIGKLMVAVQVGLFDMLAKTLAYYFHERMWNRIPYGRMKPPEYEI